MTKEEMEELERAVLRTRNTRMADLFRKLAKAGNGALAEGYAAAWKDRKRELTLQWFGQRRAARPSLDRTETLWNEIEADLEFLETKGVFDEK